MKLLLDVEELGGRGLNRVRRYLFVDPTPFDEPACARDDSDPSSAFAQYIMPRVRAGKDEASKEVLEYLKVEPLADAIDDTIRSLPANKTRKLRTWVEEAAGSRVYRYVRVDVEGYVLEADVGFMHASEGPHNTADITTHRLQSYRTRTSVDSFDASGRSASRRPENVPVHLYVDISPRSLAEEWFRNASVWRPRDLGDICRMLREVR